MNRRLAPLCLSLLVGAPLALSLPPGGSIVVAILGISFLIFVHEWGHFYACKLTGTRTETFSIGFGPRLFGWEKTRDGQRRFTVGRRQTDPADHAMDFRVAAVPLGGYVKMAGELPGEGGGDGGEPAPDEFPGKSAWARIFIVCAGVIMNFITAFVFYSVCIGVGKPYEPPLVGLVESGSAAWHAGVMPGDRIERIDSMTTPTFLDLKVAVAVSSDDDDSSIVLDRGGERQTLTFRPVYDEERGLLRFGVAPAAGLELGEGETAVAIGPTERVTLAGVPVVGGTEAVLVIQGALENGILPLELTRADGSQVSIAPIEAEVPSGDDAPGAKVGVAPYAEQTVLAVRGVAQGVLEPEDVLLAARTAGGEVRLGHSRGLHGLPFRAPVTAFVVRRGETERTVEVALPDAAATAAFLQDVAIDAKTIDGRYIPLDAGSVDALEGHLYRYGSAPAKDAGLPEGAVIKKVRGLVVGSIQEIAKELGAAKAGETVPFTIEENGKERVIDVTAIALEHLGRLKVTPVVHKEPWQPDGFGQTIAWGWDRTVRETANVFRTIGVLISGDLSFNKNIAGPVTLISASKDFAEDSWTRLVWFLAYVSVMLAVLNILPIPVLDGGHLMFIIIEKIRGKPLSDNTIYNMQKVGFLLLLVLMFFAFKNDFQRLGLF